jgi:hypothetical protein
MQELQSPTSRVRGWDFICSTESCTLFLANESTNAEVSNENLEQGAMETVLALPASDAVYGLNGIAYSRQSALIDPVAVR